MARPLYGTTIQTTDTTAASATIGGGITAGTGSVALVTTAGKLASLNSTFVATITTNTAGTFLRSDGTNYVPSGFTFTNSAVTGDILAAASTNVIGNIAAVATGSYLRSAGTSTVPVWSTLTLPNAATSGNVMYASGTNVGAFNANFNIDANGLLGIGGVVNTANLMSIAASTASGTDQRAVSIANLTTTSAATSAINGYYIGISTAAASYSTANLRGFQFGGIAKGSGHTITRAVGFQSVDFTTGTNNALIFTGDDTTFTGNWAIYQNTTHASYFGGGINVGTTSDPGAGNIAAAAHIPNGSTVPTNGMFLPTTNTTAFATNSAEVARFTPAGGLLVGTSATGAITSVAAGDAIINGHLGVGTLSSTTGTALIANSVSSGGYTFNSVSYLTSSARFKEHIESWHVSPDDLAAFVRLTPAMWDYLGGTQGATSFISEDLDALPIRNAYGRSPMVNYDDGLPFSNRDHAIIALQHLVLQQFESRLTALEAKPV